MTPTVFTLLVGMVVGAAIVISAVVITSMAIDAIRRWIL